MRPLMTMKPHCLRQGMLSCLQLLHYICSHISHSSIRLPISMARVVGHCLNLNLSQMTF